MKGIKDKIRQKKYLRWILFVSNWLAQGIINADKTERFYKITFTLVNTIIIAFCVTYFFSPSFFVLITFSFFIGHTLNWLINGSISTILLHRLFIGKLTKQKAFSYLMNLTTRLEKKGCIQTCAVFGSISRGEIKESSDIDITFVRKKGFVNALLAIRFMMSEKYRTNRRLVPIEPFLADSISYMKKRYRSDEIPVVIKGEQELLSFFKTTCSLEEAAKKNNYKVNG